MTLEDVKLLLSAPKKIVITAHRNPDGDALGSTLGLYHYLKQLGHTVQVAFPSDYPVIFTWMPDVEKCLIFDAQVKQTTSALQAADLIFMLDYNVLERIDKMGEAFPPQAKVPRLMIDHHREPDPSVDFMLSDITASSTSELVFDFITSLGDSDKISLEVAECLYTGIITDTGSFRFSTSPKLFRTVARLVELGVNDTALQDLIQNCLPEKNLRLLGHCLHNRMEVLPELKAGIIYLTKKDYESFEIQRGDTEGIVNYLLMMRDVHLGCFIAEQPSIVKISMRSKGDLNVQEICRDNFRGGGHKNASGGFSYASLKATLDKVKEVLEQYKPQLLAANSNSRNTQK
jgi:bifunctional oligoribonuclease and PAP phosphatase NrnA